MNVVSDSSPLVALARIDKLDLVRLLYENVLIPDAVWQEIVIRGAGQPGSNEVKTAPWIRVRSVKNKKLVRALRQELDAGESEAIVLSLETEPEALLLMDERLGREVARHMGLRYTGIIGVLIEAKNKNLITNVKPFLDSLKNTAGFHINETLYSRILKDLGEKAD
jgi:predicted nucleic acid-binding protein